MPLEPTQNPMLWKQLPGSTRLRLCTIDDKFGRTKLGQIRRTADEDFDVVVGMQWKAHLDAMRPEMARTKNVGGTYYKLWLANLDLGCVGGVNGDSAGSGTSCDGSVPIIESTVELRPVLRMTGKPGLRNILKTRRAAWLSRNSHTGRGRQHGTRRARRDVRQLQAANW